MFLPRRFIGNISYFNITEDLSERIFYSAAKSHERIISVTQKFIGRHNVPLKTFGLGNRNNYYLHVGIFHRNSPK